MKRNELKKLFRILLPLLAASLLLAACALREETESRQYRIWLVSKSTTTEFWRSVFAGANAARAEYNVDLTIRGADTEEDVEGQNRLIDEAVKAKADAIVFSAISYTENAEAINRAAQAGVRIVVIDSDVDSNRVNVRIGTDNVQAGYMTASAVLDSPEEVLNVGIVNFAQVSRNGEERERGLREALENDSRVRDIYTINVITDAEKAKEGAEQLLKEHPEINVLTALNEPLAVGAALASKELDLKGKVRVVCFDSNLTCIDLLHEGAVSALIVQNPYAMGYLGVEYAWRLMEGESFNSSELIDTSTRIVTGDNMFSTESQKALFPFE